MEIGFVEKKKQFPKKNIIQKKAKAKLLWENNQFKIDDYC